jgi:Kef-type K+ transport system membrane component KefB
MHNDYIPLIVGGLVLIASLISLRLGISVAIIEILLGTIAGNLGLGTENWMLYLANFGGIILTYLAGTEIDTKMMRDHFKSSFLIGFFSFLTPFVCTALFTYYIEHWTLSGALIAGCALSTTSLAVVYSVLVETGLSRTSIGKKIMSATFITDMGTALALSVLFIKPTLYTLLFVIVSTGLIFLLYKYSLFMLRNKLWANKVIEPEIKFIFFVLLAFMYFAKLGEGHAI